MNFDGGRVYDPETVELLKSVLDDAWDCLPPERQKGISKTLLAENLLRAAAHGERDPERLRARALLVLTPPTLWPG